MTHSSRFGQSTKIAQAVSDGLRAHGIATDVVPLTKATAPDPARHDAIVMVMSVRYGHFAKQAEKFVTRYRSWLDAVPTLLMTVSLTARTPEKRDPAKHVYTRKFLEKMAWVPSHVEVVAGALEYPRYNFLDRSAIRLIMTMTHGPTDPRTWVEYTDWERVAQVADEFAGAVESRTH
ncbi:MAG: menaquinone-dependent protoporphyrinogen IX dehydrogenase [Propionibacteriaceae bacterium]|nr:menaquinone-dependent protoporphyrinogen IX dehydrogenase [Propionibacteriaceae bacterium]